MIELPASMAESQRGRQKNADGADDFSDPSSSEIAACLFKYGYALMSRRKKKRYRHEYLSGGKRARVK